jgi:hypothetical protein
MRTAHLAAAIGVLAVLTTGCSAVTKSAHGSPGPVEVTSIPMMTTAKDKTLPIEDYLLNGRQMAQVQNAINILEVRCMARFGYAYAPLTPNLDSPITQTVRRYGATDLSVASSYGYHAPAGFSADKSGQPTLTDEERQVLTGGLEPGQIKASPSQSAKTAANGQAVPYGGCTQEATGKVQPGRGMKEAELADDINLGDYQRSIEDPRVKKAFAAWSTCMKGKGYSYPSPMDAMNDRKWAGSSPTPEEIATATADLECKTTNNVIGIWFAVESALQRHDIDAKIDSLTKVKDDIQSALKRAADVTAER